MERFTNIVDDYYTQVSMLLVKNKPVTIITILILYIFYIICLWKIFEKAGEKGWKSLVPFYNSYIFMKTCWVGEYYVFSFLICAFLFIINCLKSSANDINGFLIGLLGIVFIWLEIFFPFFTVILMIIAMSKLAKRFGKSAGFTVGLILLYPVFLAILAFDGSDYDRHRTDRVSRYPKQKNIISNSQKKKTKSYNSQPKK